MNFLKNGIVPDKTDSILHILSFNRIVEFWSNDGKDKEYPKGLHICERCDSVFEVDLSKKQAQQLVDELQLLVNQIPD